MTSPENNKFSLSKEFFTEGEIYRQLRSVLGINAVSGLPCGELRGFISQAFQDKEVLHIPSTNEREAIGIAAGMWLGGRETTLYMQNSGLFLSSNDIGSLLIACRIPTVIVVSWRGVLGETATQHHATGKATIPLLNSFELPFTVEANCETLFKLKQSRDKFQLPVCILKKRERFNQPPCRRIEELSKRPQGKIVRLGKVVNLSREEVLNKIISNLGTETAVFSSTGLISRSIYENYDSPNQFYNAGALGLTSAIALGFAMARPDIETVIIEGDGSVLADIGNMNLIGYYQPDNFHHIVIDNGVYLSCSGEPTIGSELIPDLAAKFGYNKVVTLTQAEHLQSIMKNTSGLQLLHVLVNQKGRRDFSRPTQMAEIARRFRSYFNNEQNKK